MLKFGVVNMCTGACSVHVVDVTVEKPVLGATSDGLDWQVLECPWVVSSMVVEMAW